MHTLNLFEICKTFYQVSQPSCDSPTACIACYNNHMPNTGAFVTKGGEL